MLVRLDATVAEATTAFDGFDYARALERAEAFFWWFCDDYVELVKGRAYGGARRRVRPHRRAPRSASPSTPCRGCSHRRCRSRPRRRGAGRTTAASTPRRWPLVSGVADPGLDLDAVSEVLQRVRRAKTEAKRSQRSEVARVAVTAPADADHGRSTAAHDDLADALTIGDAVVHACRHPRRRRHARLTSSRADRLRPPNPLPVSREHGAHG